MKYLLILLALFTVACAEENNGGDDNQANAVSECIKKAGFGPVNEVIIKINEPRDPDGFQCQLGNRVCSYDQFIPEGEDLYVSEVFCGL